MNSNQKGGSFFSNLFRNTTQRSASSSTNNPTASSTASTASRRVAPAAAPSTSSHASSSSSSSSSTIDLHGYVKAKNKKPQHETYVPRRGLMEDPIGSDDTWTPNQGNALSQESAPNAVCLNIGYLPQTNIIDVLARNYPRSYSANSSGHRTLAKIVNLETVVQWIEGNVVALSRGRGEPFGSGLLISPNLLLTARHCIEGLSMNEIKVRLHYQVVSIGMDFGAIYNVVGVVEEDSKLDYVILLLKENVRSFSPINFSLEDQHSRESVFFHHPDGGPKKVSVHASLLSEYYQVGHSSFHDSEKGSSGGIYANARGEIFAMHLLVDPQKTYARFIRDIYRKSWLLHALYFPNGEYRETPLDLSSFRVNSQTLSITEFSEAWYFSLERVKRILDLPPLNDADTAGRGFDLAYHHIIPIGDMEFLWMMGKENPLIEAVIFDQLSNWYPDDALDESNLKINAVAWAPWNIFIGPDDRTDDKKKSDVKEENKPLGFNVELWDNLDALYKLINICWDIRNRISQTQPSLNKFRTTQIGALDKRNDSGTLGALSASAGLFQQKANQPVMASLMQQYSDAQENIIKVLASIIQIFANIKAPSCDYGVKQCKHGYIATEWYRDPTTLKYKLHTAVTLQQAATTSSSTATTSTSSHHNILNMAKN